jgi:hypothetical protein
LAAQQKSRIAHDIPFNPVGKFGKDIGITHVLQPIA